MRKEQRPSLTEAMRDAAYKYAARLMKKDPSLNRDVALREALSLAERNLLTVSGFLKPKKRKKPVRGR